MPSRLFWGSEGETPGAEARQLLAPYGMAKAMAFHGSASSSSFSAGCEGVPSHKTVCETGWLC